jgi:hypothetical protein
MTGPASHPPEDNVPRFLVLAQSLQNASRDQDYALLGRLLENLRPEVTDVMVYIRPSVGHLTLVGGSLHLWMPPISGVVGREPSLAEMAEVLRAASRP